ncbi:efflux ABC transporter [Tribonema minus]|uniref:Efflux ABC transporter n=1 Tax=Tribonema minus TaxID=303371 RepID=A0A835ZGY2_9STRA|nr:efflux ABC transporter [Tribonema minus]
MWSLARPEGRLIGSGLTLLAGTSCVSLAFPRVMGGLIDAVMGGAGTTTPYEAAAVLMGLFSLQSLMLVGRSAALSVAGERIAARLRRRLFQAVAKQDMAFFDANSTGELVNRLASDVLLVQKALTSSTAQGLRSLFLVTGSSVMMYTMSPYLAAVSVAIFPPVMGAGWYFGRKLKAQQKSVQAALAGSSGVAEEVIGSISTVRAFGAEQRECARYNTKVNDSCTLAARVGVTTAVFEGSMHLGAHASLVAVMAAGGAQLVAGALTVGDMTSFLLYSTFMALNVSGLGSVYADAMRAIGASDRVMDIIRGAEGEGERGGGSAGAVLAAVRGDIRFDGVQFLYPTRPEHQVLQGLALEVQAGKTLAVVGPSGCGKSTLCRLLTRLYEPSAGSVTLDGVDISSLDVLWLREKAVGIVDQEPVLFNASIADNIRYGRPEATDAEVVQAAKVANAHEFITQFSHGYQTQAGASGQQLSGGQRQRIAIARAVLKDPAVLLLDEFSSALDSDSEQRVQEALEHVTRGRTSIIIAHRLSTARAMADKIAVMDSGRVVESGSFDELMARDGGVFRRMYLTQVSDQPQVEQPQP